MTEAELRAKVVSTAQNYYGCKESDGSHKKIIDIYNAHTPLARGYKVQYTDAWCAAFVSAVSILCDLTDIMPTECGCGPMITLYQKLGRWQESDSYVPKAGDVIMYYWNDGTNYASTDCTGSPDHVGIVVSVSGTSIRVIEGNKSDSVSYRTVVVNGRYIRGYCLPDYASKATAASSATNASTAAASTKVTVSKTVQWNGYVTASELNVRTWAGVENATCSFSPLQKNTVVGVCDSVKASDGTLWYYIVYNGKYGFASSKYIQKQTTISSSNSAGASINSTSTSSVSVDYASAYSKALAGTYKTTANLNLRSGAGTSKSIICIIPKGDEVTCYGYYTSVSGTKWYFVAYQTYTGFVSSKYLSK